MGGARPSSYRVLVLTAWTSARVTAFLFFTLSLDATEQYLNWYYALPLPPVISKVKVKESIPNVQDVPCVS